MAYRIEITELADQDLDEIFSYIALSLANPTAARDLADAVDECYDYLEKMPLMYRFCDDPRLRAMDYHKAVIKNYVMVYQVDEAAKVVNVMRFFYGGQDYEKLI